MEHQESEDEEVRFYADSDGKPGKGSKERLNMVRVKVINLQ